MADLDFFEKFAENLECPMCLEKYQLEGSLIPKRLECGHNLCTGLL